MSGVHLFANKICPFCQRVQILLTDAEVSYRRTELDFTDKPAWFVAMTPLAKVPLLVVEGSQAIFESSAILEYLNELSGNRYLPKDLQARALARSWCAMADKVHDDLRAYFTARTESDFDAAWKRGTEKLRQLVECAGSLAFVDKKLTLPGVYFAPIFVLVDVLSKGPRKFMTPGSNIDLLSQKLLSDPAVMQVNDENYKQRITKFLASADTFFARSAVGLQRQVAGGVESHEINATKYLEKSP